VSKSKSESDGGGGSGGGDGDLPFSDPKKFSRAVTDHLSEIDYTQFLIENHKSKAILLCNLDLFNCEIVPIRSNTSVVRNHLTDPIECFFWHAKSNAWT
jgi:hypothetical protein